MKVIIDTEKLRAANPYSENQNPHGNTNGILEYQGYGYSCTKAEEIGTPVADIVEQLRSAMKLYGWDEDGDVLSVGKIIGSEKCCDRLERILKVKK